MDVVNVSHAIFSFREKVAFWNFAFNQLRHGVNQVRIWRIYVLNLLILSILYIISGSMDVVKFLKVYWFPV